MSTTRIANPEGKNLRGQWVKLPQRLSDLELGIQASHAIDVERVMPLLALASRIRHARFWAGGGWSAR